MYDVERQINKVLSRIATTREVLVGIPRDAPDYPDGTSLVRVAVENEFGTDIIPERSFLRKSVKKHAKKYLKLFHKAAKNMLRGSDEQIELMLIGMEAAQDVKQQIDDTFFPPNSPHTIRKKGSSHPLIDTGHLKQQVTYVVREKR